MEAAFDRACILAALGRNGDAAAAYHAILRRRPDHFGALNNLGLLLYEAGSTQSALRAYTLLCERHPDSAIAHAHLAKMLHDEGRSEEAVTHYQRALVLDPTASTAYHGLATILSERGDEEGAARVRRLGYRLRPVTFGRYRGSGEPVRLLVIGVDGEGNIPTRSLFDDRVFGVASLIVDFYDREAPLPPHDIVFNAIGDADRCALALAAANEILAQIDAPVINRPSAVLATGRVANAQRLGRLSDVVVPRFGIFPRWLLARTDPAKALAAGGFSWPLLLRAPGFHTGQHFVKVDEPSHVSAALDALPGTAVIVLDFVDTRNSDGSFRKYRVMSIDGQIYPLHLAISGDWKVHYFTADMEQNPRHRDEDAAFLSDPRKVIGSRAYSALERISETLDLEYAGIDFSLDADGRLVLFEANATMIVQPPPPDERWDYRRRPVERIIGAVQSMLKERVDHPTRASR